MPRPSRCHRLVAVLLAASLGLAPWRPSLAQLPGATPPVTSGLFVHHNGESWNGNAWQDLSGAGRHATVRRGNPTTAKVTASGLLSLTGGVGDGVRLHPAALPKSYTLFWVARYSPASNAVLGRIFDGYSPGSNWMSGFHGGRAGVGYRDKWVTPQQDWHGRNWVLGCDYPNMLRTQGVKRTFVADNAGFVPPMLSVNHGAGVQYFNQPSTWQVAAVLVYNRILSSSEINSMEQWLSGRYAIPLFKPPFPLAASKPPPPAYVPPPPVTNGLWAYYTTTTWNLNSWQDASGNGNHAVEIRGKPKIATSPAGIVTLAGGIYDGVKFPVRVLPTPYTMFWVASYSTLPGASTFGRIFDAFDQNWLSGFRGDAVGAAYHGNSYIAPAVDCCGHTWVIGTDGFNMLRTQGVSRVTPSTMTETPGKNAPILTINAGRAIDPQQGATQPSDWMVASLIVYNRTLSQAEIADVEKWLSVRFGIPLQASASPNPPRPPPPPPSPPNSPPRPPPPPMPPFPPLSLPPVRSGLMAYYPAESWTGSRWSDMSGNGWHATQTTGTIRVISQNGFPVLSGDIGAGLRFPPQILPYRYTLFYLARYSNLPGASHFGRIFDAYGSQVSFWSGFASNQQGVAFHGMPIATASTNNHNWITCSDTLDVFRCDGTSRAIAKDAPMFVAPPLALNFGDVIAYGGASDWEVATVIVYNRTLSLPEIQDTERWINNKYRLGLKNPPAPPPKPPLPPYSKPSPPRSPSPPLPPVPPSSTAGSILTIGQTPNTAVHIIHIPGGEKYLILSRRPCFFGSDPNEYIVAVMDMSNMNSFGVNISDYTFCSGHEVTADGDIVVVGGWPQPVLNGINYLENGANRVRIFSRTALKFVWDAMLPDARYYPTVRAMGDGRLAIMGGNDGSDTGSIGEGKYTTYLMMKPPANPATATSGTADITRVSLPSGFFPWLWTGYYPITMPLPDGALLTIYDSVGGIIDAGTGALIATLPRFTSSMHWEHRNTATYVPLMSRDDNGYQVVELVVFGGKNSSLIWTPASSLSYRLKITVQGFHSYSFSSWAVEDTRIPRIMGDAVVLPNGQVVLANGIQLGTGGYGGGFNPAYTAQLYDPDLPIGSRYSSIATSTIPRGYHANMALTVDGTVLIAGCDDLPLCVKGNTLELITPPIMQSRPVPRPIITSVTSAGVTRQASSSGTPLNIKYGALIQVAVSNYNPSSQSLWATIVRPTSSSHSRNFAQHVLKLKSLPFQAGDTTYRFQMPPNVNVATPGWYMIFVMSGKVYSKATWIVLKP